VIELGGVSRVFEVGGRPVHALREVSLEVPAGEYLSVMGPSGSGKSTLLNILGCLDRPTAGSYRLGGEDVGRLDERALSRIRGHDIGFVFQAFHLVPRMTAVQNVELPMVFAGVPREERAGRVRNALGSVGLLERAEHRPEQLSGGERQRVAIARAVVMGPKVLLADEPTGNLDSVSGAEVVALLERMNAEGLTLVVVSHDPAIGGRARRRVRMADGAVVDDTGARLAAASLRVPRPAR
jgi:putative ABC transport system ATP-binding protein